ncbi:Mediator of RNA polymerase II transcription [Echinococcus multilocularis]|uniref:Mediator of RNA polymerase II transcription subunit 6 n=1 Tax=Echinococcus multilocularis TaxID=6211 RepID=A0A068YDV0_ECHMU|nr:Mediator of RNA polymerase II transcription [Echinococcus multilocularis]
MDGLIPDHASPYEIHWENPAISPHQLNSSNILQYFCHLSNPFYDRECNNEVVRMQGLSQDKLTTLCGTEFYLYRSQEPVLFVIRKQERLSPSEVVPLAYYYIINGIVRQAPDLSTLINSRLHTIIAGLNKAIQTLAPCARFHPSDGSYSWEDPNALAGGSKRKSDKKPKDDTVATNPYQVHRTDFLLNEWVSRFPMPPLPNTLSVGSTLPTPQQTSHSSGPAPSNQTGSLEATSDKRQRLIVPANWVSSSLILFQACGRRAGLPTQNERQYTAPTTIL